jgi:hypothetical protein
MGTGGRYSQSGRMTQIFVDLAEEQPLDSRWSRTKARGSDVEEIATRSRGERIQSRTVD